MASMEDKLVQLLEPLVESLGYELVLLEYSPHHGSALVRLFIDATGGVTLGDCERVSREVEGLLDVEDPVPQNYRLEVSSPGLDRPLVKPAHFERFAGKLARVQLVAPRDGRRKFQGVLRGMRDERVVLEMPDGGTVEFAPREIERARLVPEYERSDFVPRDQREKELRDS
jgi:ribosome maturation factor RimP